MEQLTLELARRDGWRTAAVLRFPEPERGSAGPCWLEYDFDYALSEDSAEAHAVAWRYPVGFDPYALKRWPAFLDDIRPTGAAERWWTRSMDLGVLSEGARELRLLATATTAPIGNLRIAEALPARIFEPIRFLREDVVTRDADFLDHAAQMGAAVGGATGAGGDAPKLLLRLDQDDQVWIDTWQDDASPDAHYLVKFPRGARTARDQLVLRSEHVYYRALAQLGFDTIDVDRMHFEDPDDGQPSLWLPRFDRVYRQGRVERLGVESLYSLIEAGPGSFQDHRTYLEVLLQVLTPDGPEATADLVTEYLARDLLNELFGNTDNHGRNTAILKSETGWRLAPIYDFAPMKLDPEGITRTTRWSADPSIGRNWRVVVESLADLANPEAVWERLHVVIAPLADLPELLGDLGLPDETLDFAPIGPAQHPSEAPALGTAVIDLNGRTMTGQQRGQLLAAVEALVHSRELTLGAALRVLRASFLGMSRREFAARVGVSDRLLANLETDQANPTVATLESVFRPFGLQVGLVRRYKGPLAEEITLTDEELEQFARAIHAAVRENERR